MQLARLAGNDSPIRFALIVALALAPPALAAQDAGNAPASAGGSTLERVRAAGKITFGYYADARPLAFRNDTGDADGYGVALCRLVAADVQAELKLPNLATQFVAPDGSDRLAGVKDGSIDLFCGPIQETLARRAEVSFSIPVMDTGTSVLMRKDASEPFRAALEGRATDDRRPLWRGSPRVTALTERTFAVVAGTSTEERVKHERERLKLNSVVSSVPDIATGVRQVADGTADAFFGERTVLLNALKNEKTGDDLVVLDRYFDHAGLSFALSRGDEDFRLLVDKSLSHLFRSGKAAEAYERFFGKPDAATLEQFDRNALRDD
jgi:polar amino acid transport system substrate-binding protein